MHTLTTRTHIAKAAMAALLSTIVMVGHAATPSQSTKVYKCEQANGQVSYSQQACAAGVAPLHVHDARSAQQVSDAKDMHKRERALLKRQAGERRKMERLGGETPAKALTIAATPPKSNKSIKPKDPRAPVPFEPAQPSERKKHFRAVAPKTAASDTAPQTTNR